MSKSRPTPTPKPRLIARDWLEAALEALSEGGIAAVSIERIAAKLGITRGSFYHHFRDRADLLERTLAYWREGWTRSVIDESNALGIDARTTLLALARTIRGRRAAEYDVAIRAWAVHDPVAAAVVRRVDEERLGHLRRLFAKMGFDELEAENRSRLFLYYEMGEPAMFARQSKSLEERLIVERHRYLTAGSAAADGADRSGDSRRPAQAASRQSTRGIVN